MGHNYHFLGVILRRKGTSFVFRYLDVAVHVRGLVTLHLHILELPVVGGEDVVILAVEVVQTQTLDHVGAAQRLPVVIFRANIAGLTRNERDEYAHALLHAQLRLARQLDL